MVEQAGLDARHDGVADAAEIDRRGIQAEAAHEAVGDDDRGEEPQHVGAAVEEHLVDDVLDQPGVERRRAGDDQAEGHDHGVAAEELAAGLAEQPGDQGKRAVAGDFRQFQAKGHRAIPER